MQKRFIFAVTAQESAVVAKIGEKNVRRPAMVTREVPIREYSLGAAWREVAASVPQNTVKIELVRTDYD